MLSEKSLYSAIAAPDVHPGLCRATHPESHVAAARCGRAANESGKLWAVSRIPRSFHYAFEGLWHLLRTQPSARIEILVGIWVCGLAAWLHITAMEWAILVLTIAVVLTLEGLNTALEAAVDLASPQKQPLAKTAKDLAAGMVLIVSLASVMIGLLILGPPLWRRIFS